jgi:trehalose 6-phosphate phosphatase
MRAKHWQRGLRRLCFCRMKQPPPPPALDWCLFLDVDGTLIELADTPSQAESDAEIKFLLREVAERLGGAVALVSGRRISTLDMLFAPLKLPAAGLHGVERRKADGTIQGASFVDSQLDRARAAMKIFVDAHPGTLLEDKDRTIRANRSWKLRGRSAATITSRAARWCSRSSRADSARPLRFRHS